MYVKGYKFITVSKKIQFFSMLFQPSFILSVSRADAFHQIPKIGGMVHMHQMAELMDNHVITDRFRGHQDPPVKIHISVAAAAPPAAFLILHPDILKIHMKHCCIFQRFSVKRSEERRVGKEC